MLSVQQVPSDFRGYDVTDAHLIPRPRLELRARDNTAIFWILFPYHWVLIFRLDLDELVYYNT